MGRLRKRYERISAFTPRPAEVQKETSVPVLRRGFGSFFLAAGVWAIVSAGQTSVPGLLTEHAFGLPDDPGWHAHEALFGYGGALLAGFLLTAVPNWTGRPPVTGLTLVGLFLIWLAGRIACLAPFGNGPFAVAVSSAFLSVLLALITREVIAGRNWRNVKTTALLGLFAIADIWFLIAVYATQDPGRAVRLGVASLTGLVILIGGRVTPHFTRVWLIDRNANHLPKPFDSYDTMSLVAAGIAFAAWVMIPDTALTCACLSAAALAHAIRLARWAGFLVRREPLIWILHVGYGFVPFGFVLMAIATLDPDVIAPASAVHAWTTGAIGVTGMAIMARAIRSHTGRTVVASPLTTAAFAAILVAALLRVAAGTDTDFRTMLLDAAGTAWIAGYAAFLVEYGPMILFGHPRHEECRVARSPGRSPNESG